MINFYEYRWSQHRRQSSSSERVARSREQLGRSSGGRERAAADDAALRAAAMAIGGLEGAEGEALADGLLQSGVDGRTHVPGSSAVIPLHQLRVGDAHPLIVVPRVLEVEGVGLQQRISALTVSLP